MFIQLSVTRGNSFFVFTCSRVWRNLSGVFINVNKGNSRYQFRLFHRPHSNWSTRDLTVWYQTPTIFYVNSLNKVHCLSHSTNLPWIDSTRLITRIICVNYTRNLIPERDLRQQTDFLIRCGYMAGNRSRCWKHLNGRQSYILSQFHKNEKFQLI